MHTISQRMEEAHGNMELGLERIVFFSDAVMAIAITLLAVDIKVPEMATDLAAAQLPGSLHALTPKIMSFVISFMVIGVYWMSHHRYFSFIKRYDSRLIYLNLLFLLFIAAMPFISTLLGEYAFLPLGVSAYSIAVSGIGLSICGLWLYASRNHRLIAEELDSRFVNAMNIRAISAPLVFMISIPISFFSPVAAVIVWFLSPLVVVGAVWRFAR
jgi:uncharacterized membrane protein